MLCQFTFSNYRSYRDEATLDMQASSAKEFSQSLIGCEDGQEFLPVAAIYGPNAGGKSNLLQALDYVRSAVTRPIVMLSHGGGFPAGDVPPIQRCAPFAFDEEHSKMPSSFELYFRVGSYEYRYDLSVGGSDIAAEGLSRRKIGASRSALIYERDGNTVKLGSSLRRSGVSVSFNPAIPYLSYLYMNTDVEAVNAAIGWFLAGVFLNYNSSYLERALENILDEKDSPAITRFLRAVDVPIDGFRIERLEEGIRAPLR